MITKSRAFGVGLLVVLATSAFAATNASGIVSGHFTHEGPQNSAWITAHEAAGTLHQLKFYRLKNANSHETSGDKPFECEKVTYSGTVAAKTITSIQMFPTYTNCRTEGGVEAELKIDPNGCSYTFFSAGANKHGTVAVDCPGEKSMILTHPNCETTVPTQTTAATLTDGITYDTVVENNKHALTATVTVNTITVHFHAGLCVFLGTNQKYEMKGSVTVTGFEDLGGTPESPKEGAQISITST